MKIEYVIWGVWYKGIPEYYLYPRDGMYREIYGGGGYRKKDCIDELRRMHPDATIKSRYNDGEWEVDIYVPEKDGK